jgi:molybdate transport system ATP-binding protein
MNTISVDIQHQYASGFALDVEFQCTAGTISLFGHSGAGKTTILSIIAGVTRPDRACVQLDGETWIDTARNRWRPPEQRQVGLVFQDYLLFPHLNVELNLRYGERRQRRSAANSITFAKVVELLDLAPLLRQAPRSLSMGQQQRVALGRALLRRPRLLLLDEPLTALDDVLKSRVLAYLERVIGEWHIPTVYVSHNQVEIRRLAEYVVVLNDGRLIDQGPTTEVLIHQSLLAEQGEFGPANLIRVTDVAQDQDGDWHGRIGQQVVSLPLLETRRNELLVCFPPNAVSLATVAPGSASVRNRLAGVVTHVMPLRDRVLVGIDVSQPIWAEITHEALRELALAPDMPITCLVKTRAMTPVW